MAWKLLAITTMLLASLTECKAPQKTVSTQPEPLHISTLPEQPSTQPKTISTIATPTVLPPTASPAPSTLPLPSGTAGRAARSSVKVAVIASTVLPTAAPTDPTRLPSGRMPAGLLCIETKESQRRYTVVSPYGDGGVAQYQPGTWDGGDGILGNGYKGFARAELAPPAVQDDRALEDYNKGPAVRHQLWPHTSLACGV